MRSDLGISEETPVLLAVGRQERQKGFDLLLDAMPAVQRAMPDVLLLVAGRRGSASDALESQVSRLGLEGAVRWLGHRSDVPDLLAACDVMVFPSRWEGLGSSVIEAIMLGTPVVCTDLDVLREVVRIAHADSWANLVDAEEPSSLAAAVVEKLSISAPGDSVDRRDLAPFCLEGVAERYARLASQVAGNQPCGAEDSADVRPTNDALSETERAVKRQGGPT